MRVFRQIEETLPTSLCLGFFDGVHEGHKVVIKNAVNLAHQNNLKSAVLTFVDHPLCYLQNRTPSYIVTCEDRLQMIESMGVDYIFLLEFDEEIADLMAYDYLKEVLIEMLHPRFITTGFNHRFGANRQGDADMLKAYQDIFRYKFFEIPPITYKNTLISSTKIRQLISEGKLENIKNLLGCDFYIKSKVKKGNRIGRTLSYPTANLDYPKDIVKLASGVYAGYVEADGKNHRAVINYGIRPTVSNTKDMLVEAYLLDYSGDLYNKNVKVTFKEKIRDEKKFASLVDLKSQIEKDVETANKII